MYLLIDLFINITSNIAFSSSGRFSQLHRLLTLKEVYSLTCLWRCDTHCVLRSVATQPDSK